MNETQKAILKTWLKDHHYLVDGLLLHRCNASFIADHFHESETGRNQRFWCEETDVREAMIALGYAPTSDKKNCSFFPSAESVNQKRMMAIQEALRSAADELEQCPGQTKFAEYLRDLAGGFVP